MAALTLTLVEDSNKAVAVGAVSFYVDHFVTGRISKFTYGAPCHPFYRRSNPEHVRHNKESYLDPAGDRCVPGGFITMLSRVCYPPPLIGAP